MSAVTIAVNGRSYSIVCDDGQEEHLRLLGQNLDKRVGELTSALGQIGEARLLLLAALSVLDELSDAYSELSGARKKVEDVDRRLSRETQAARAEGLIQAAVAIEALAERLEAGPSKD